MNFIITVVLGIILLVGISRIKQLKQSIQGEIFCAALIAIELIQCIIAGTVRIFSRNAFISIIFMILLPFVILCVYFVIVEIKKTQNNKSDNKIEDKE